VILDSLITGRREIAADRRFYEGVVPDGPLVDRILAEHPDIDAVIHGAALIVVPDSVADPVGYYRANVNKSLDFAAHLLRNGCGRLIFSSSAAIYRADADPMTSATPFTRSAAPRGVRTDRSQVRCVRPDIGPEPVGCQRAPL
jgi:UDP-glucose 4-epimerase